MGSPYFLTFPLKSRSCFAWCSSMLFSQRRDKGQRIRKDLVCEMMQAVQDGYSVWLVGMIYLILYLSPVYQTAEWNERLSAGRWAAGKHAGNLQNDIPGGVGAAADLRADWGQDWRCQRGMYMNCGIQCMYQNIGWLALFVISSASLKLNLFSSVSVFKTCTRANTPFNFSTCVFFPHFPFGVSFFYWFSNISENMESGLSICSWWSCEVSYTHTNSGFCLRRCLK